MQHRKNILAQLCTVIRGYCDKFFRSKTVSQLPIISVTSKYRPHTDCLEYVPCH